MPKKHWGLDLDKIKYHLDDYRKSREWQYDFKKRTERYRQADALLTEMISVRIKTTQEFMDYYEQLVGAEGTRQLWHSGGLLRQKNRVAENYEGFLRFLKEVKSSKLKSAADAFHIIVKYTAKVPGLGVNVPTEVLNTIYPDRFAVLNGLTIKTLAYFGCKDFPGDANLFDDDDYEGYNKVISYLMKLCEFRSMGEVDHFLSYIFSEENPPISEDLPEPEHSEYFKIIDAILTDNAGKYKVFPVYGENEHCVYFQKITGEDVLYVGFWIEFYSKFKKPICYGVNLKFFPRAIIERFQKIHSKSDYIEYENWLLLGFDEESVHRPEMMEQISQTIKEELSRLTGN